ncbi:immunoglobulin-like domain-containing protein [Listeria booriae]|uniref:Peptidase M60 domain-containing protein n=1 Tax=Listeria booriae TaxID=1552123 RepID=A0A7X0XN05_9LIST|nr:immunoglobulin-like domain-containing protein [Listeria booriae]MBC1563511.1 hypothetical protein [Listeria booriae]
MILKQLVVACAIALGLLIANTHEVEASEFKSKDLYTLEDPTWFRNEGFTKGIGHDKQDFGVLLRPGGTIEVRQTNANFKELVTIELLNDDDKTEKAVKVGSDWVSIKADVASVPFAVTTYTTIKPTLEYNVTNATELPTFKAGENDSSFFRTWDGNQSDFALISNNYIQILVPIKDKKYLMNMEKFANMDELFEYYDTVFETYNELAGISFTPSRPTDKNVGNKYFAKANKSGPAAAYYGGSNAATSGASISEYWLNPHWGNLHEIAHGYQGSFMNDITFSTAEVWNNIYANAFEQKVAGNNYAERWLYKYQPSPTNVENTFQTKVYEDKIPLSSWDVVMKLYALTMMTDKAGLEAFSHFNQEYRQLANEPNFVNTNLLLDMLSKYYAEASDFNMAPFIDLVQGSSSPRQEIQSLYGTAKNVYPAAGLLSGSNLERVKNALSLESKWSLVDNSQLEKYHFSSDATITFDIDDFSQLQGQVLRLKDGGNTLQEIIITQPTMVLKNIPVGIYSIDIPYGLDKIYKIDKYYIPITDETNVINLKMSELKSTEIGTQKMTFKGLGDIIFATATVNPESGTFSLDVTRGSPHSYFDSSYAIVEIFDAAGRMKFRRDMNGLTTQIGHFDAEIEIGDLIRVTHQEISRFSVSGSTTSLVGNQRIQNYEVTKYGLENTSTNNSALSDYKDRLVKFADAIIEDNRVNQQENAIPKAYLEMAINYLDEPDKKMYKDKYGDLFVVKSKDTILYNSALALLESLFNDSSKDTLKTTTTQAEIDVVQGFVNQIVDVAKKAELQKDLDEAQKQLTAKKEVEEKTRQAAAEAALKALFYGNDVNGTIKDTTNQVAIENVQGLIDVVTDPALKVALQAQVDKAQAQINTRNPINGTVAKYTVGDLNITGTYSGPATALSVDINGKRYYGGTIADGRFKYYVGDKNLKPSDVVTLNFYDANKQIQKSIIVTVFEALKITIADYKIGDNYLTATYNDPEITKIGIVVDGTKYWGGDVKDGNAKFFAADKIKSANADVTMNFYDASNNLIASKKVTIATASAEISTANYTVGATNITGTFAGDIRKLAVSINGTKYYGGSLTTNGTYKFYALDKKIKATDTVIVYGYDANNGLLSEKTVTIVE